MQLPNKIRVLKRMREYDKIGRDAFLDHFAGRRRAKAHYILHDEKLYDLKAVWAAAHLPAVLPKTFNTRPARVALAQLGFVCVTDEEAALFEEGQRSIREFSIIARSPELAAKAKQHYGYRCAVCNFDFEQRYGSLGTGYIECHHIDPLSGREGKGQPTELKDVTVLCSNCHRMIHHRRPALTIAELKQAMRSIG
jgi:predicted restriction endonuclease